MAQYKKPLNPGTSATDGLYTYCHVIDIDSTNKIAHVIDQLGNPRQVSITRSMGKQLNYPAKGEDWIITRQFGDWIFAVNINASLRSIHEVPAGGVTNAVLAKIDGTDYDVQWLPSTSANTSGTVALRDANGRSQFTDPIANQDASTKAYTDSSIATATGAVAAFQPGMLIPFAGTVTLAGYLLCNGQAVSRTTFANLFSVVGTIYGVGDGLTTFNVPNLLGKVVVGMDAGQTEFSALNTQGGAKTHNHTSAAHAHTLSDAGQAEITVASSAGAVRIRRITSGPYTSNFTSGGTASGAISVSDATGAALTGSTDSVTPGSTGLTSNLSPYITLNYLIKT